MRSSRRCSRSSPVRRSMVPFRTLRSHGSASSSSGATGTSDLASSTIARILVSDSEAAACFANALRRSSSSASEASR